MNNIHRIDSVPMLASRPWTSFFSEAVSKRLAMNAALAIFSSSLALSTANASSLQAYAFSAGGESSNPTTGPTTYMNNDYPGGPSGKFFVSAPGAGYNVNESTQYFNGNSGTLSAASAISAGGMGPNGTSTFSGSSHASASYGVLGVSATGSYSGQTDPAAVRGSEAFATFNDSFTIPGVAGSTGYFIPTFTVHGTWNDPGNANVQFEIDYSVNNNPTLLLYRTWSNLINGSPLWYGGYVNSLPGLTVSGSSVSGSTNVSISPIAFKFNQAFNMTIDAFASVIPGTNGSGTSDFINTATLTGITVLDSHYNPLTTFSISSGSGTLYTANGVSSSVETIPEPATVWFLVTGLVGLFGVKRRLGYSA